MKLDLPSTRFTAALLAWVCVGMLLDSSATAQSPDGVVTIRIPEADGQPVVYSSKISEPLLDPAPEDDLARVDDDPPPEMPVEPGPRNARPQIARARKTVRVADDTPREAAAFKPTLSDTLVRPAQFVISDDEPNEEPVEEHTTSTSQPPQAKAAATTTKVPLKLAKKKERSSADEKKPRVSPEQSLRTMGGSLALVIALLLGMAVLFRKAQPKGAGVLPLEVIEVLGRSTLTKGQNLQLVRIGGKLVLLCVTAHGSETLTEITDADEVERLSTLCRESGPKSVSAAFRDVLAQIGNEPAPGGFVGPTHAGGNRSSQPTSWWQQQYS